MPDPIDQNQKPGAQNLVKNADPNKVAQFMAGFNGTSSQAQSTDSDAASKKAAMLRRMGQ